MKRKNASKYVGCEKATFKVIPSILDEIRSVSFHAKVDMSQVVNAALLTWLEAHADMRTSLVRESVEGRWPA